MSEWKIEVEETEPDHNITFAISEPDDSKTLTVLVEVTWCKYKEQVAELEADRDRWKAKYLAKLQEWQHE